MRAELSKAVQIAQRREQVQRLLVRGLSVSEIARSVDPPVDAKTIQRDIAWIRRAEERWWRENAEVRARLAHYLKERLGALRELLREGWLIVHDAKDDLKARVAGLNLVLGAEKVLSALLGFTGVSMLEFEVQQKFARIDPEIAELKRLATLAQSNTIEP